MRIELYKSPENPVPTPFVNGMLQYHFANYLIIRYRFPDKIRVTMKKAGPSTITHIANDTRMLLENLAENGVTVEEATWSDHIQPLLQKLSNDGGWSPETYNIRYSRWRDYFDYLTSQGVMTQTVFPRKETRKRFYNDEDDLINYTSSNTTNYTYDHGHKRVGKKSDYTNRVISLGQFYQLHAALMEIDAVFAVMAKLGMLTMLRVENLVQIPFRKSSLNKHWMIWPNFERSGRDKLQFHCIAKRRKHLSVDVYPAAIQVIYDEYIKPYFDERKNLYKNSYKQRKNASLCQGKIELPEDILWLTETGAPVKPYMLQAAFREASKIIGFTVEPHWLRHTGATHLLYGYCKVQGIEPDTRLASVFHQVLKGILGHENVETTRMYIRTLLNQKANYFIPHVQQKMLDNKGIKLDPEVIAAAKGTLDEFYGETAIKILAPETVKNSI